MRAFALAIVFLCFATIPPAEAEFTEGRVVEMRYDRTSFAPELPGGEPCAQPGHFCFEIEPGATHARVEIIDDLTLVGPRAIPAWIEVYGDVFGSRGSMCGSAITTLGGHTLDVEILDLAPWGSCDHGCPEDDEFCPFTRAPTSGVVRVTFLKWA